VSISIEPVDNAVRGRHARLAPRGRPIHRVPNTASGRAPEAAVANYVRVTTCVVPCRPEPFNLQLSCGRMKLHRGSVRLCRRFDRLLVSALHIGTLVRVSRRAVRRHYSLPLHARINSLSDVTIDVELQPRLALPPYRGSCRPRCVAMPSTRIIYCRSPHMTDVSACFAELVCHISVENDLTSLLRSLVNTRQPSSGGYSGLEQY